MAHPYQSTVRNLTGPKQPHGRDSLFTWTVGLFVLAGVVILCWLGSFYVTGHPENPAMYRILQSAKQIGAPTRFETTAAPQGKFFSAKDAFDHFSQMTSLQLDNENAKLLRNYIRNYKDMARPVPYLHGKFVVVQAYSLSKSDFIAEGLVVLTQAVDHPQVLVEVILPAAPGQLRSMAASLSPGNELKLDKTLDLTAVVHVARIAGGYFQLSVVPIQYGTLGIQSANLAFSMTPPLRVNVGETLPVIHSIEVSRLMKGTAEIRRTHKDAVAQGKVRLVERLEGRVDGDTSSPNIPPAVVPAAAVASASIANKTTSTPPKSQEPEPEPTSALVSGNTTIPKDETPSVPQPELPDMKNPAAIAKIEPPLPQPPPESSPKNTAPPQEGGPAGMSSRPTAKTSIPPKESPPPHTPPPKVSASIPKAALVKAPTQTSAQKPPATADKPIKSPQISSSSQPPPKAIPVVAQSSPNASPPPPPRTNVHFRDVVSGAASPTQKVLRGKFVVTATGANQAVLRPLGDEKLGRVIVEYPRGAIPNNGQVVDADSSRLEIVQVSQSPDGTKTVRVKEAR
jgi:hypothetical protein